MSALSHITGGGLLENIPRVLPEHTKAVIDCSAWEMPPIFSWLQRGGNIAAEEMYRTLNCGVGMVIAIPAEHVEPACTLLRGAGEHVFQVGIIETSDAKTPVVELGKL